MVAFSGYFFQFVTRLRFVFLQESSVLGRFQYFLKEFIVSIINRIIVGIYYVYIHLTILWFERNKFLMI